ncbi:hypothetical protein CTKA_00151 [Chthonomonas calidirosea]|uniref:Uncharacterized protein n=1 Tax=Chthonomonas calidirosea (strain DSM 23976 / ICMP 18418 / T49) TaxID=1303518 RepID=S0EWW9_CHTCT|nr:hypothetical protein [Chthonomonas calidirosea]CCW34831.1 hypothetical protein CCALI_01009 [Chthonomonas calidirosea T49]CEK13671.1 hypothetical protein CTKA_00151 [Chthonomonas calidirosea]
MIGVLIVLIIFAVPLSAIWTEHLRQVRQMELETRGRMNDEVLAEIAALRQELQSLRDTTTQYDLSFDTALQTLERRMQTLERRVQTLEQRIVRPLQETESPQYQRNV